MESLKVKPILQFKYLNQMKTEIQGSGMGLFICSKIAHRHHGTLSVTSKQNEGARFIITLPEKLRKVDFSDFDLRGVDFSEADLRRADLRKANLEKVKFFKADLRKTLFTEANLTEAYLSSAWLQETDLLYPVN